jgi:sensor histidine kinase YesM
METSQTNAKTNAIAMTIAEQSMFSGSSRNYWLAQAIGWTVFSVFMILTTSGNKGDSFISFTVAKLFCALVGFLLSHQWRAYLKKKGWFVRKEAFPITKIFFGLLLISTIQFGVVILADWLFRKGDIFNGSEPWWFLTSLLIFLWFVVFLVWTLCYAIAHSQRKLVQFEFEKLQLELNVKDAELRALQAQVNPHFFFNSLNTIRALVFQDQQAAANAIGQLAGMMRHSLTAGQAQTVKLADEIKAVEAYLSMEKLRFEERLQFSLQIDKSLENLALPPMILQTLVENAIKHGVEVSMTPCEIQLLARRIPSGVEIIVANQGKLSTSSESTQLGLQNARKRLSLLFGDQASCELIEEDDRVKARIFLPGKMQFDRKVSV